MSENTQTPAVRVKPEIQIVHDDGPLANLLDSGRFAHLFRIASAMASASLLPNHLREGKRGEFTPEEVRSNCFLIVNQSIRWGMDPFSVMPETYVVGGKLAYQGKLVAAVINARAGLSKRLSYKYSGTKGKDDFTITVSGTFPGEDEPRTVDLSVGDAKTQNDMWRKDPEQKLVYSGATKWARRHCPEILLGIVTDDDIERMNETAKVAPSIQDLAGEAVPRKIELVRAEPEKTVDFKPLAKAFKESDKPKTEPEPEHKEGEWTQEAQVNQEVSIAKELATNLTNKVAESGVALKFFISAIVSNYPKAPASLKLLSELDAETLDSIDTEFDSLVESAKGIAEKRK